MQANMLSLHPGVGLKGQFFSEKGHAEYQIKGKEVYHNMQAKLWPLPPPPDIWFRFGRSAIEILLN